MPYEAKGSGADRGLLPKRVRHRLYIYRLPGHLSGSIYSAILFWRKSSALSELVAESADVFEATVERNSRYRHIGIG